MAKNTVFILLSLSLLLFSCSKKPDKVKPSVYDFEIVKTFQVLLDEQDRYKSGSGDFPYQLAEIDNKPVFISSASYKKISIYDIESGEKIHEILTDSTKKLKSFKYVNKDSIFCFYDGGPYFSDPAADNYGQLQLVDYNGNVKERYKYNIDSIEWKDRDLNEILPPYNTECYIPLVGENLFFSTHWDHIGNLGTKKFMDNPLPILMRYNTMEQQFYISKHNKFPYIKEGIYYPTSFESKNVCISGNNFPLIRFVYSSDVFEWDYKKDELIAHSLKSRLLDTIPPSSKPTRIDANNLEAGYHSILYDKNLGLYFSYLDFMEDFYGTRSEGYSASTIVIADKNFEYMGEMYCKNYFPGDLSIKDYIVDYSIKNDSILEFYYMKLVKTDRDYDRYIDSCKKDLESRRQRKLSLSKAYSSGENYIIEFLKSHKKVDSSKYTILTVYAMDGCLGCTESVLSLISQKREIYENAPFYLIVTANDSISAYRELEGYGLGDFKNLVIDSVGVIKSLTVYQGLRNPRLTLVENNDVALDTIYDSFDIHKELVPKIIKQVESKEVILVEMPFEE